MSEPVPPPLGNLAGITGDPLEDFMFRPMREAMMLGPVQWKNFTSLVVLHLTLDRMLSLRIALGLAAEPGAATAKPGTVDQIIDAVAELSFHRRVGIAETAGWATPEVAGHLREVNRVRNRLLHFNPNHTGFEHVPEIATAEAFKILAARGNVALRGILAGELLALFLAAAKPDSA
jgi:hypothetical protein